MRERGLKPEHGSVRGQDYQSLPVWERGLKQGNGFYQDVLEGRSPCKSVD